MSPATAVRLRALADSLARELIDAKRTGGLSVAVVRGPDTLVHQGYGRANVELNVPATAATVYRIGSVTKQFTAALVQKLAAAGTLSVDDGLARWVELPSAWRSPTTPVTVRHLLTHTSGIPSYTGVDAFLEENARHLSHEEVLAFVRDDSLEFTPRTDYSYSNTGYYLLGMVIEETTGQPYDNVLRDSLLAPMGLEDTSYCWQVPIIPGRADGYARSDSVPGLWTRAVLANGDTTDYGFGLSVSELDGHRKISHGGGINGFSSALAHYPEGAGPEDDLTVAVLVNSEAVGAGSVEVALGRAALGIPTPAVSDRPVRASLAERLTGRYVIGGELPAGVRFRSGNLFVQAEGQRQFRLLYQGTEETDHGPAAVFRAEIDPENVKLDFLLPGERGAESPAFILHQGGGTVRADRVEP